MNVLQNVLQLDAEIELLSRINTRTAKIAIVGLGYVGLPLAVQFARCGFAVTGIDVDENRVFSVNDGSSHVPGIAESDLQPLVTNGRLLATLDFKCLRNMDVVLMCVPTPLDQFQSPDTSYITIAASHIQDYLHRGQLVVLESTTSPGTTNDVLLPLLEASGLKVDKDFFLAFSPERIDIGNNTYGLQNTTKLVGGVSPTSTKVAVRLYQQVVDQVQPVSSSQVAEMAKLLENTFRNVNIALVNEIAQLCHVLNINVWEVIEAAATKPFGFMKFNPGGVGGYCIPFAPHYLTYKARLHGYTPHLLEMASKINQSMPDYILGLVTKALSSRDRAINGAKILLLGISFKPEINDYRESPAVEILEKLYLLGSEVEYSDPYVPEAKIVIAGKPLLFKSCSLNEQNLAKADCVIIVTNHQAFNWRLIVHKSRLVVDTRNALADYRHYPHILQL
jgi:UDP-N-acetyl-D-glucosamine dehydrogenase